MPLERRAQQPRSFQRQCRGRRQDPYRLPTRLRAARREGVTLALSTRARDAPVREPFEQLAKRHSACVCCTSYDVPVQTDDVRPVTLLEVEAEETQRTPTDQRPQTNPYQGSWHLDNPTLRSDLTHNSNHGIPTPARHEDSISSDSSHISSGTTVTSNLSPMIPNVVPLPSSSELSHALAFVTSSNRPTAAVQSARMQSTPTSGRQDPYNADEPGQLKNHDRSVQERVAAIQGVESTCSNASLRSCRRSMSHMASPSAYARQLASRVIKHARDNKTPDERSLWCPNCKRLPVLPVTGQCGHTRCTRCIEDNGACPCGVQAPKSLHVNTLIQGLIRKIAHETPNFSEGRSDEVWTCGHSSSSPASARRRARSGTGDGAGAGPAASPWSPPHAPMSLQCRFEVARRLASAGRHREAAPHMARVAARPGPLARIARALLAQSISVLSSGADARRLARALYRAVRAQGAGAWLRAQDLECALCYHVYTSPVTTPCGHTYCRTCIERSMDYRKSCALCLRSLNDFDLATTRETVFVCAALESIDALTPPMPPPEPDVIPIFVCTVAYPAIPCPLFIFDPRYWLMIRRVLESGSRKFGMVAYERDGSYSDYGTVLEVCDCVHLEDGRSILSTVGVSRFRVIKRDVRDGFFQPPHEVFPVVFDLRSLELKVGSIMLYHNLDVDVHAQICEVARIQSLTDIAPTEELTLWQLRLLATQVSYKALLWLNGMSERVRAEIEAGFGRLPRFEHAHRWWDSPDGPAWLWWLIAILPLRSEIKILILSTRSLVKRMMAVSRTLDAIEQVSGPACAVHGALSTAADWLERGHSA